MRTHTIDDPVAALPAVPISSPLKIRRWTGCALSGLAVLFMAMDSVFKLVQPLPAPVTESFVQLGYGCCCRGAAGHNFRRGRASRYS